MQACNTNNEVEEERREASPQLDTEMELEEERWAENPEPETARYDENESQDHCEEFSDHDEIPEGINHSEEF